MFELGGDHPGLFGLPGWTLGTAGFAAGSGASTGAARAAGMASGFGIAMDNAAHGARAMDATTAHLVKWICIVGNLLKRFMKEERINVDKYAKTDQFLSSRR